MASELRAVELITADDLHVSVTIPVFIDPDGTPLWPSIIRRPTRIPVIGMRVYVHAGKSETSELIRYVET